MSHKVYESWPDYAALSAHGERASLGDDLRRGDLSVSVVLPYWAERSILAHDCKTGAHAQIRLLSPLDGGGTSPNTLKAVYNLQGAMLSDVQPQLGMPDVRQPDRITSRECVEYGVTRLGEMGQGALCVQRINRNWLGLTVTDEGMKYPERFSHMRGQKGQDTVTVFFNRLRSPNVYKALLALGHAIRLDNKYYPREQASPSVA